MISFLRGLMRTGEVRAAAKDAGIDHTTAYQRRKAHPDFARAWDAALHGHRLWMAQQADEGRPGSRRASGPDHAGDGPLPGARACGRRGDTRELAIAGGKARRVHAARWTQGAERRFFAALADTANVKAAADAAGFSTTAVYARRLKHAVFREQWAAAVETGRARLELALIEAATSAIERGIEGTPDAPPQVSVHEALQILKIGAEPNITTNASGRRILNEGAAANRTLASDAEVRTALARSLRAFGVRVTKEEEDGRADPMQRLRDEREPAALPRPERAS